MQKLKYLFSLIILTLSFQCFLLAQTEFTQPTNGPFGGGRVRDIQKNSKGTIFASVYYNGVYKTTNNGDLWIPVNMGLDETRVRHIQILSNDNIFIGTDIGLYFSSNGGDSWSALGISGLDQTYVKVFLVTTNGNIFIGNDAGLFRTTNSGINWSRVVSNVAVQSINVNAKGYIYFAANDKGIYKSTDNGNTWSESNNGITYKSFFEKSFNINDSGEMFVGVTGSYYFYSTDEGNTWIQKGIELLNWPTVQRDKDGTLYAKSFHGFHYSSDNGVTWQYKSLQSSGYLGLFIEGNDKFYGYDYDYGIGIFYSTDKGTTWTSKNNNIISTPQIVNILETNSSEMVATTKGAGLVKYDKNSKNWIDCNNGIDMLWLNPTYKKPTGELFTTSQAKLFRSTNNGQSWDKFDKGFEWWGGSIFSSNKKGDLFTITFNHNILYRSVDNGNTWEIVNSKSLLNKDIRYFFIDSRDNFFIGTEGGGFLVSTDGGVSWNTKNFSNKNFVRSIVENSKGYLFTGHVWDEGVWRSTDGGQNWAAVNNGIEDKNISNIAINSKGHLFASSININHIYRSTDYGTSWIKYTNTLMNYYHQFTNLLISSDDYLFTGTGHSGIYSSSYSTTISAPLLTSPYNTSNGITLSPTLTWTSVENGTNYKIQISTNPDFSTTLVSQTVSNQTNLSLSGSSTLQASTTYYWRIQASNICAISDWSEVRSFTTLAIMPTAGTRNPLTVAATSAKLSGYINPNGDNTKSWFEYGTSGDLNTFTKSSEHNLGNGKSSILDTNTISGLLSNTTYYFRVAAQNSAGTAKGDILSFTSSALTPSIITVSTINIDSKTASLSGNLYTNNMATTAWFEYSSQSDLTGFLKTANQSKPANTDVTSISADLIGLTPNTTYYFRLAAQNTIGLSKGEINNFKTLLISPAATTSPATNMSFASARLNGIVNTYGDNTKSWFEYGTISDLSTFTKSSEHNLGNGRSDVSDTCSIYNLLPSTTYYYRIVAQNSAGTSKGTILSFNTSLIAATVETRIVSNLSSTSSTLNGILNTNNAAATVWFEYGTESNLSTFTKTSEQSKPAGTSILNITADVMGLMPNITYYFRIASQNTAGISKGNILNFKTTTLSPTTTTNTAGTITSNSVTFVGKINPNNSETTVWFEWGTASDLSTNTLTNKTSIGAGFKEIQVIDSVSGLAQNTSYYYRIAGQNEAGTSRGTIINFTTPFSFPNVTTSSASSISSNSATLNGIVNPNGSQTSVWFEYSKNGDLSNFSSTTSKQVGAGNTDIQVTEGLSSLDLNATYYFRVVAQSMGGIKKGGILNFTTNAKLPTVTTNAANSITTISATLNGAINPNGLTTSAWFEYGTNSNLNNPSITASKSIGSGTAEVLIVEGLSGLSINTTYYFRSVGQNSAGTQKGSILTFTTSANLPLVNTSIVTGITSTTATLKATVNPNGAATTVWFEYGTNNSLGSNTSSKTIGNGTSELNITEDLTALNPNTVYYYRIAAQNGAGTQRGSILNFSTRPTYPTTYSLNTSISFPELQNMSDYKATDYKLIGLPGKSESQLSNLFTGTQGSDWQAFWDNGANSNYKIKYDGSPEFKFFAGRGFWILKTSPLVINLSNVNTVVLNTNYEAEISLHSGWNIITNPFNVAIQWSKVLSSNNITDPIWKYEKGYSNNSSMDPFVAYYFDNRNNLSSLKIPYNPTSLLLSKLPTTDVFIEHISKNIEDDISAFTSNNWFINIIFKQDNYEDKSLYLGISENAGEKLDLFDFRKPRAFGDESMLYFDHSEWGESYKYMATDVRPYFNESKTWEFVTDLAQSATQKSASLQFTGLNSVPSRFDIYLVDIDHNKYSNLRIDSVYNYFTSNKISRFKIIIGDKPNINETTNIPNEYSLSNYPNPFNPTTKIDIKIPKSIEVKLGIYNLLGKEVKTIYNGLLNQGQQSFEWDGKDENGTLQPSGIYICRLMSNKNIFSNKMILMK